MKNAKVVSIYLSFLFLGIVSWTVHTYGKYISLDQIVFHLTIGFDANAGMEVPEYWDLLKYILIAPVFCTLLAYGFFSMLSKCGFHRHYLLQIMLIVAVVFFALNKINVVQFVKSFWGADIFSAIYTPPKVENFVAPKVKKNIILIYVESLESSLRSMAASNVLQPIDSLVGMEVERFHQAPGTNWSIAGMISSQCGIPVKAFYGNKANKYASKEFLPHAVCMSDVLYEYGYHQIFMVGPDLKFAGMDKFYSSHKFQEMYGRDELRDKVDTKVPFNGYGGGPNDDVLFDAAYSVAEAQAKQGKPFNLTIITTDNHFPQGFPSLNCTESERRSGFLGTYKCTSKMVRNFVENINANSLFQNTDIVIMGDHLFMANEDQQKLFPTTRSIYFKYISKSNLPGFKRSEMTHFDVAPTILEALGFVSQDKSAFGLGYSLFDDSITNSYIPSRLDDGILNRSKVYDGFWGIR